MGKSCAIDSILPSVVSKPEDLPAGRILVPGAGASSKTEDGDEQAPWEADEQERERKEEKRRRAEAAAERSRREEEKKRQAAEEERARAAAAAEEERERKERERKRHEEEQERKAHEDEQARKAAAQEAEAPHAEAPSLPQSQDPPQELTAGLPQHGRVAVLLRGEAFRCGGRTSHGCCTRAHDAQVHATRSLVNKVIVPLQEHGNLVHVYLTESSGAGSGRKGNPNPNPNPHPNPHPNPNPNPYP